MRVFFIILLFLPLFIKAQDRTDIAEVFASNDYEGKQIVRVKWLYNSVYHPNGFDLYRGENGNYTKLNNSPILPVKTLPANHKLDDESKDFHKVVVTTDFKSLSENMTRIFIIIKAIYADELAFNIGMGFKDETAVSGNEYTYKVCVAGTTNALGISKPIKVGSYLKMAAPENIKFKRFKKRVDFSWKPDLYRYYGVFVYRRTGDETTFKKINQLPRAIQKEQADKYSEKSVFYQDTNIVYKENYIYKFAAIDYFGQETEFSPEFSVPAEDFIPPSPAFDFVPTASSVNSYVRLDYKLIDEIDLVGINVYETINPDTEYKKINTEIVPKSQLSYTHLNASVGSHYYKIATVDLAGNENLSPPVYIDIKDITPPSKPVGLVSESGEGFISLKWTANTEKDLSGYLIQRSLKKESTINTSYVNVNSNPIKETSYTEQLPKNVRNEFVYRIVAIDTNFNRSVPSENTLAKMPDVTPPLQPVIKNVKADTTMAVISWLPNADLDLAGYNLYRRLMGDTLSIKKINFNIIPSSVSNYTDREVKAGTAYEYFIESIDQNSNVSIKSPAFYAKTFETKLEGKILIDVKKVNAKKGTLILEWTAESKEAIKGFVVYRQTAENLPFKPMSGLITENRANLSIGENTGGTFYIKCYTENGKTIQSENFNLIAE
jgi:hypothetical protein